VDLPSARDDALSRMITLPPVPRAVAACRAWSRQTMARWRLSETTTGVVEQLISELVTNSIEHANGVSVTVLLVYAAQTLRIEVRDNDSGNLPVLKDPELADTDGRGLIIVEALADHWGVRVTDTGKSVWCDLAIPQPDLRPGLEAGRDG
jgi:anti-sigma regulatory factor (Ser/Thr protein kinase)